MPGGAQVGKQTIGRILAAGTPADAVIAGVRRPEAYDGPDCVLRRADYDDPGSMTAAFAGVDTLILIPTKSPLGPRCLEHWNALNAARDAGVSRIVFLSILSADPGSVSAIAPFILFAENATRNSGMDWVIARMGLYIEPVGDWVPELLVRGELPYPVREGRVAYVTRDDIARTLAAIARDRSIVSETLSFCAPPVTMADLAAAISAATGTDIPFRACSSEEFIEICCQGNETPFITDVLLSLYRAVERGEFAIETDDVERLTGKPAQTVSDYLVYRFR
jgi:NAD(P)H dehydrogenase (quinone)